MIHTVIFSNKKDVSFSKKNMERYSLRMIKVTENAYKILILNMYFIKRKGGTHFIFQNKTKSGILQ